MSNLYLMCGAPGSGKSTYAKKFSEQLNNSTIVSRDEIRFSLLEEGDNYFAKEPKVFKTFCDTLSNCLVQYDNVIADATHLSENARNKVLDRINLNNTKIIPVCMMTPLGTCLERNQQRDGKRRVKKSVLEKMYYQFELPTKTEKHSYQDIIIVKESDL